MKRSFDFYLLGTIAIGALPWFLILLLSHKPLFAEATLAMFGTAFMIRHKMHQKARRNDTLPFITASDRGYAGYESIVNTYFMRCNIFAFSLSVFIYVASLLIPTVVSNDNAMGWTVILGIFSWIFVEPLLARKSVPIPKDKNPVQPQSPTMVIDTALYAATGVITYKEL